MLILAALLIGVSKAGFGGGTGFLVGPLLVLVFPAKECVGLMLPLLLVCDAMCLIPYWRQWDTMNVLILLPGAALGVVLGTLLLDAVSNTMLARGMGLFAIGFALLQAYREWHAHAATILTPDWWPGSLVGASTGFVSTVSHMGGVITVMYLLPQRLENARFVGTTTAIYFLLNTLKVPAYWQIGVLDVSLIWRDVPLIPVVILGTALGVYLNRRISSTLFSRVILVTVLLTGVHLLLTYG
ncbi:MAG: sulfite exporter TauE/SafE family protein [Gemmataceae bacterium]